MGLATSICQPRETITTMTVRPFMAILPQKTQVGDEIILKGRVKDDAQMFSVNFTLDCCPDPPNIAYSFHTNFVEEKVTHNYRTDGIYGPAITDRITWIENPGQEFILLFRLTDREIVVYTDDYNYQYSFEYQFDFGDVKAVQVWHDVDSIEEVTFRYNKKSMN